MGPASWRWVERAYASWQMLEAPGALERIGVPVLIATLTQEALDLARRSSPWSARRPDLYGPLAV